MRRNILYVHAEVLRLSLAQRLEGHVDVLDLVMRDWILDPRDRTLVVLVDDRWRQSFLIQLERFTPHSGVSENQNQFLQPFYLCPRATQRAQFGVSG